MIAGETEPAVATVTPPAAAPAPATAAVLIVNRRSFNASRGLADRAISLARQEGAEVMAVDGLESVRRAVASVVDRRPRLLAILAGDGTVQAIADALIDVAPDRRPDLLVLPGGRSNLTAVDLGVRSGPMPLLQAALRAASTAEPGGLRRVERSLLRVEQSPAPARHGFFVAAAMLDTLIRDIHAHRAGGNAGLRAGPLSTIAFLARLGLKRIAGQPAKPLPELDIEAGPLGRLHGSTRLLLLSTLQHSAGAFDPYAKRGVGELRVAAVSGGAQGFWRRLPRLLTGRYSAAMDTAHGYLSGRCERVEVRGLSGYTLDGESFATDPSRPIVVSAGPTLRFLVP